MEPTTTLVLIAVFAAVALVAGSATYLVLERASLTPLRRRLHHGGDAGSGFSVPSFKRSKAPEDNLFTRVPSPTGKTTPDAKRLGRRLEMAGLDKPFHFAVFRGGEIAGVAIGAVTPLLLLGFPSALLYSIMAAILGYMIPGLLLDRRIAQRRREIENGLPDALDLLIVCLEAGLALDQALLKCSEELRLAHPLLADQLHLVNVECRAGKPRVEAFKNFASRTKVDDVRGLVAMLVQTDRFGTSIAQALRTHAEVSRTKRRQRAEEAAAKMGVKLVFPLVFCLFPAFYIVTLGPAVLKFMTAFGNGGISIGGFKW